jgi:SOS-response transcriptional repressor LexA
MHLKDLVHRELGEGVAVEDLASAVGVSVRTIADILADKLPQKPALWEQFAQYFHIPADLLRSGGPPYSEGQCELSGHTDFSPLGQMRKVPLLRWNQVHQMVLRKEPPRVIHAEALLETDVPGKRSFALQVRDDSMRPLFNEGEIIFVNPELPTSPGHYVVIESEDGRPERTLLRQLMGTNGEAVLHPLNHRYKDQPLTKKQRILGRIVRIRKNL